MKLLCPVCGAKLYNNVVCKYCKDVTAERILSASNKLAKQELKNKNKENVHYSNCLPNDINKKKLWFFILVFGWFGVQNFYVGKTYKGLFHALSLGITFLLVATMEISETYGWGVENGVELIASVFALLSAVAFLLYISDIFALLFKKFKVPVVLGDKK